MMGHGLTQLARFLRLLCAIEGPAAIIALHVVMRNTVEMFMTYRLSVKGTMQNARSIHHMQC